MQPPTLKLGLKLRCLFSCFYFLISKSLLNGFWNQKFLLDPILKPKDLIGSINIDNPIGLIQF